MMSLKTKVSTPRWRESVAFYCSHFGMSVVEEWDEHNDQGAILAFRNGCREAFLELCRVDKVQDLSGLSLQFKVQDIESFVRKMPTNLEYEGPKTRPWGSTYVYLHDPAGVLVIVYEGGL